MSVAALVALFHDIVDHDRHLCPLRLPGDTGGRDRSARDPGVLALRHRGRVRQDQGEHHQPPQEHGVLRRRGQPRRQPDPGALDQHQHRGADPDRRDPLRERGPAGCELAAGPRPGAVRRHGRRRLLVGLCWPRASWCTSSPPRPRSSSRRDGPRRRSGRWPTATPRCRPFRDNVRTPRTPVPPVDDRPSRPAPPADADDEPGSTSSVSEEALGKGRVAPAATRPVSQSSSSGRQQPTRQSRSKRGKK